MGVGAGIFAGGHVEATLAISPTTVNLMTHQGDFSSSTQTFTATGGSEAGYTYTITAHTPGATDTVGSSSGVYTSQTQVLDAPPQTATVRVTDSEGHTADAVVTVYNKLIVDAPTGGVNWSGDGVSAVALHAFTATGGAEAGYAWGVSTSTNSTINSGSGVYQAGDAVGDSDDVTVTDSLGFTATHATTIGIFRPEDIASCVLAYDSRFGVTTSSGKVSAWTDRMGDNHKDLAQATSGNRPTWTSPNSAYNNMSTADFAGAHWLEPSGNYLSTIAQPLTWYMIGELATGRIIDGDSGDTIRNAIMVNSTFCDIYAGSFVSSSPPASASTPEVVCAIYDGASSAVYVNNHASGGTGDAGSSGIDHQVLGAAEGGVAPGTGKIAMAFAYSGHHDATTRLRIFTQLSTLSGIAIT